MNQLDILAIPRDPALECAHRGERTGAPELRRQYRLTERLKRTGAGGDFVDGSGMRVPNEDGGGQGGSEGAEEGATGERHERNGER